MLDAALRLRVEGRYPEARTALQAVVASATVPLWAKEWAITEMLPLAQNMENALVSLYLESIRSTYPSLGRTIDFLMPHVYLAEGLRTNAMELFDSNILQYSGSELERDGLYGRFQNALYFEDDTASARTYLTRLESTYPRSDEALVASHFMSTYVATLSGESRQQMRANVTGMSELMRLPGEFSLSQNYPNPFNPSTSIRYDVPSDSRVTLKIYDMLGREVVTLVDGFKEAGYHQVTWDADNVATGVYFFRLTAGQFTDVKKLVVVK